MIRSILMGLVAGQRSMTPLAALAGAARRGTLPHDNPPARLMTRLAPAAGGVLMAAAEMAGDKMKTAPDRTVPVAREWLRGWGPARAPKTGLMLACACVDGCCEVCN